jgi:hypothetical protein
MHIFFKTDQIIIFHKPSSDNVEQNERLTKIQHVARMRCILVNLNKTII